MRKEHERRAPKPDFDPHGRLPGVGPWRIYRSKTHIVIPFRLARYPGRTPGTRPVKTSDPFF